MENNKRHMRQTSAQDKLIMKETKVVNLVNLVLSFVWARAAGIAKPLSRPLIVFYSSRNNAEIFIAMFKNDPLIDKCSAAAVSCIKTDAPGGG
jgi:hypothetical protein